MLRTKFLLYLFKAKSHINRIISSKPGILVEEESTSSNSPSGSEAGSIKAEWLKSNINLPKIYFVFRSLHFVDFFVPIHLALNRLYPNKFLILYVDYAKTLKRLKSENEYYKFKLDLHARLTEQRISSKHHFSADEIAQFKELSDPDIIVTTEGIRHETFDCNNRIFIPHGCVVKEDVIQTNIRYNHFFQPSKPPYTYKSLKSTDQNTFEIHQVGYPKINLRSSSPKKLFNNNKPVVIFAPSIDIDLLLGYLKQGLLSVFLKMSEVNFILKLHPSLGSNRHYIVDYIRFLIRGKSHVLVDSLSNIQDLAEQSSLMITDFGGVGPEYRLTFGKRLIYLELPDDFESGSDLKFRDDFNDSITPVSGLSKAIKDTLILGDLNPSELKSMRDSVLFNPESADSEAAEAVHRIFESLDLLNRIREKM